MNVVGVLLIVLGATVIWLLGIQGYDPQTAISHVEALFGQALPTPAPTLPPASGPGAPPLNLASPQGSAPTV